MTPVGLVMAGCWQINSILTNIGHRNFIQILNQYPFFWNILISTQFICFIKLSCISKIKIALIAAGDQRFDQRLAGENKGLIRSSAESVPDLNNTEIAPISWPVGVGVRTQTPLASPLGSWVGWGNWLMPCSAYVNGSLLWQTTTWHGIDLVHEWRVKTDSFAVKLFVKLQAIGKI